MLINTNHLLVAFLGLTSTSRLALAQVKVNQLVGYATLNGGIPISGPTVVVNSCDEFQEAAEGDTPTIIHVSGTLEYCRYIDVGSDKFILGIGNSAGLYEGGLRIQGQTRVIIRNMKFVPLGGGGGNNVAVLIEDSTNIWVDHCAFESEMHISTRDYSHGLIDATHGSDWITISWCKFYHHWKGSDIGHSDENEAEDTGKLHVTYHHNLWDTVNTKTPGFRFGTGHVYSSCYYNIAYSGINSVMNAKVKIEQCYFKNVQNCIATNLFSPDPGYVQSLNNVIDSLSTTSITQTTSLTLPYQYWLTVASSTCAVTIANAGVGIVTTLP